MIKARFNARSGRNWRVVAALAALMLLVMFMAVDLPVAEAAFSCPATSPQYTVTLPASVDTFVNADNSLASYGLANFIKVGQMYEHQWAFMRFPRISTVDADFDWTTDCILNARLDVYVNNIGGTPGANVQVRRLLGGWGNFTTWAGKPAVSPPYGAQGLTMGWNSFNVTPIVSEWVNAVFPDFGIALTDTPAPDYLYNIRSREFGGGAFAPQLVVTYQKP